MRRIAARGMELALVTVVLAAVLVSEFPASASGDAQVARVARVQPS